MLGLAVWLLRTQDFYKPFEIWAPMEAPKAATLIHFLRLGLPSGLAIGVEVTSFTLMSLFIARLGVVASASHQIVANMAAVLYMVPLSLSIASSARISFWMGANQVHKARHALRTGLGLVLLMCISLSLLLWTQRMALASFYTQSPEVAALAATLLAWLVLYHLADAIQVFCVFALRSYGVTFVPLVTYTLLLWGVGLAGGYEVAYAWPEDVAALPWLTPQSPMAFWQTSSLALCFTAALLLGILWREAYRQRHKSLDA
jgi:MATE family multidrug resistance protein